MAIQSEFLVGFQSYQAGRLEAAEEYCRRVLTADSDHSDAWHLLGLIAFQRGQFEPAAELIRQAIQLDGTRAAFHNNLGNVLQELGQFNDAVAAFGRALALAPDNPSIHANLGNALQLQGKLDEAALNFHNAIRKNPSNALAHFSLGNALKEQQKLPEATDSYQRALQIDPTLAEAEINLASVLRDQGKLDEAIAAYRRALEAAPDSPGVYTNLGYLFQLQGKLGEAERCFRKALELKPESAESCNNLGAVFQDQGRLDEAVACYGRALALKPDYASARSNLLVVLQYRSDITLAELATAHAEFERLHAAPLLIERQRLDVDRNPDRPLIVGFISPNFGQHPVGHFVIRALENLDREQFKAVCYSDRTGGDEWTKRFEVASLSWRETNVLNDVDLTNRIRADRVDLLFDLAGHTAKNRLLVFARKPAPIQITWADYVGTTGLSAMDYLLADRHEVPRDAETFYSERVLRMPNDYVCYDPPAYAPPVAALPATANGFVTFSSFNYRPKISPEIIGVWARILKLVPNSRLVLKNRGMHDDSVADGLRQTFAQHGVEPQRIEFQGWSDHAQLLAEYQRIDLALDPFPYNGGLTTCEALWMGVPVVTCPGATFASRHSLSHLSNIGLTETIARNLTDYVDVTVSLAGDFSRLAKLRSQMRERMKASPLCDGKRFADDLMTLLRGVWRQWCAEGGSS